MSVRLPVPSSPTTSAGAPSTRSSRDSAPAETKRSPHKRAWVGRLRRYRAELAQLGGETVAVLLEIAVERIGHDGSMRTTPGRLCQDARRLLEVLDRRD